MGGTSSGDITSKANQLYSNQSANLNTLRNTLAAQYGNIYGNYNYGVGRNLTDYSNIMNQYGGLMGGYNTFLSGGNPGMTGGFMPPYPTQNYPYGNTTPGLYNAPSFLSQYLQQLYTQGNTGGRTTPPGATTVGTAVPRGANAAGFTNPNPLAGPTGGTSPQPGNQAGGTPITTQPVGSPVLQARARQQVVNRNIDPNTGQPLPTGGRTGGLVARGDPGAGQTPAPGTTNYGNLTDPTTWMNLVGNSTNLGNWLSNANPQLQTLFKNNPSLLNYYVGQIQKSPGANPTEQAGSANYWINKAMQDPGITGGAGGGGGAGGPSAINSWQQAIQTGMITPQQQQDLMARAVAPVRAAYQTAAQNVDRSRALTGGYAPNYDATQAQLARQQAYGMSDAETNAAASIVGMIQQGKLAGIQGLTGAQLGALAGQQGALSGLTGLYGTNPALASTFGNQALTSGNQLLSNSQLNQELMNSILSAYVSSAGVPSGFQSALGDISSALGLGSSGASIWAAIAKAMTAGG